MRQKIISLSLDTYELASKKANFSAWVRRKLLEEVKEAEIRYGAYCKQCDVTYMNRYNSSIIYMMCDKCGGKTEYLGAVE